MGEESADNWIAEKPWSPWPTIWWSVAGAIVALAGLGFGLWWWMQPDVDDIAAYVKSDMQSFLVSDSDMAKYQLTVTDVALIHVSGNEYQGIATVRTRRAEEHKVPVEVVADGDEGMWETERGAWLFLLREPASSSP